MSSHSEIFNFYKWAEINTENAYLPEASKALSSVMTMSTLSTSFLLVFEAISLLELSLNSFVLMSE
jgi:hypothetical protein